MKYFKWLLYLVISSFVLYFPINWITNALGIVENRSFLFVISVLMMTYAIDKFKKDFKRGYDDAMNSE